MDKEKFSYDVPYFWPPDSNSVREFPQIDKTSWFYKNCKRQRKRNAKICQACPFREGIEEQEEEK
jgi:predicted NUDIX family NTP pyrophosphohydrolase